VPNLHFVEPNPKIPFDALGLVVQTTLADISSLEQPALIGVNSFGIGGTNVHIVLEEHRPREAPAGGGGAEGQALYVLPVSAKSTGTLKSFAHAMAARLADPDWTAPLADISHSLIHHRSRMPHRLAVVGASKAELAEALESYANLNHHADVVSGVARAAEALKLAFVFSGHGAQWWGMGRELFQSEPAYRKAIEECDRLLLPHTGWSVVEVMHRESAETLLDDTGFAQPALFAMQCALVALWDAWGVRPDAVVGHSVGEVAAACAAGALSLEAGARLIACRARIMRGAPVGAMAAIDSTHEELQVRLAAARSRLSIAAINGPRSCTVAGEADEIEAFLQQLREEGVSGSRLSQHYAFHTAAMEPCKDALVRELSDLTVAPPTVPFASTVSGQWCADGQLLDARYWGDNLRETVSFFAAIRTIAATGITTFVEIGAHPTFGGSIAKTLSAMGMSATTIPSLDRRVPEPRSMRLAAAALFAVGRELRWDALQGPGKICMGLPTYCWDRQRYWLDEAQHKARQRIGKQPLLTTRLPLAQPAWESVLDQQSVPHLDGARFKEQVRFPTGVLVELACEASQDGAELNAQYELVNFGFGGPYHLTAGRATQTLQTILQPRGEGVDQVRILAEPMGQTGAAWQVVASGEVRLAGTPRPLVTSELDIDQLKSRSQMVVDGATIYQKLGEIGVRYGTSTQLIEQAWQGAREGLARLSVDKWGGQAGHKYKFDPLVFDAVDQALRMTAGAQAAHHILGGFDRLCVLSPVVDTRYVYVRIRDTFGEEFPIGDAWLLDDQGRVLAVVEGLSLEKAGDGDEGDNIPDDPAAWFYRPQWSQVEPLAVPRQAAVGRWLLLTDGSDALRQLGTWLAARGNEVVYVYPGSGLERLGPDAYSTAPGSPDSFMELIQHALDPAGLPCAGVVHAWGAEAAGMTVPAEDNLPDRLSMTTISLAFLAQALTKCGLASRPRLWVVTRQAQLVGKQDCVEAFQSQLWGLGKGIAMEHPELHCCRIDLSQHSDPGEIEALCAELAANGPDGQVALRRSQRYVQRIVSARVASSGEGEGTRQLGMSDVLQGIPFEVALESNEQGKQAVLLPARRQAPGPNEVELRIESAVLQGHLARQDGRPRTTGSSGRVVRVGPGVSGLAVGDTVMTVHPDALRSHLVVPAAAVLKESHPTHARGRAGMLYPYVAAKFALARLAALKRGQAVLVHGAEHDIGQAMVHLARMQGAKVYIASYDVGTLERAHELGAHHGFHAADPSFIQQLRSLTGAGGVHAWINCTPRYDLQKCIHALNPFGRLLDLATAAGAEPADATRLRLPANTSFQSVDLDALVRDDPAALGQLLEEVGEQFASGHPSLPVPPAHTIGDIPAGLARGAQTVQVSLPVPAGTPAERTQITYRADASYLLTGGLGGLGLNVARRMVHNGARHLILVGRSKPSLAVLDVLAELEREGATCTVVNADMGEPSQVRMLLQRVASEAPPLRGVIHAAGVLDNGLLVQLTEQQFRSVSHAKMFGAWHLHECLEDTELDFFVMFSSLAAAIGSPGQSNYSAANAFLDGLAEHRQCQGKPGLSVAWGPWAEAGMAASAHSLARLAEHGMGMIPLEAGLTVLDELIASGQQGALAVLPMHWRLWAKSFPLVASLPYFEHVLPGSGELQAASHARITAEMLCAMSEQQQHETLQRAVYRAVCNALRVEEGNIDADTPLTAAGLDSILALELKSRLEAGIDVVVQTYGLLKGQSVRSLAQQFRAQLLNTTHAPATAPVPPSKPGAASDAARLLERIDEMSEEQVAALLSEMSGADCA
jgi:acyl transferase domain-containing protein